MSLPCLISADRCGLRSQRGCWPWERVSTRLCFLTDAQKGGSVCVCVCLCLCLSVCLTLSTFFLQVFYRAEFRLAGGDLPTSRLLPRPHQPQRDIWRLQRESQVSNSHRQWRLCYCCVLTFNQVKCDRNHYGNHRETSPERNEMQESRDEDCRKTGRMSQGESGSERASESF